MSLTSSEIGGLVQEIRPLLLNAQFLDAWEEEPRKLYLSFRTAENQILTLLLCFQEPFLRFNLATQHGKKHQDSFSRALFHHLGTHRLNGMDQIQNDRILQLSFKKGDQRVLLVAEFFSKRPNLFLMEADHQILHSLNPRNISLYQFPEKPFAEIALAKVNSCDVEKKYLELEKEAVFLKEKSKLRREISEKQKRSLRFVQKKQEELKHLEQWPQVQHEADLLQANLFRIKKGMQLLPVSDWNQEGKEVEIALNLRQSPSEMVQSLYKKAKKMRLGIDRCQDSLKQASQQIQHWEVALQQVEQAKQFVDLEQIRDRWQISVAKPKVSVASPFFEFISHSGEKIWVGKGAKENEKLTFSHAKGNDWWLHVRDFPGAHVVIPSKRGERPDLETLQEAFQVGLAYSKAKNKGIVDIVLTQCKYVNRSKQKTGQVYLSQHEVFQAAFDAEIFQKIKSRLV